MRGKWRRAASLLLGPLTTWTGGRCGAVERPAGRHTGERRLCPGGRIRVASVGLVQAVSGIFAHVEPAASIIIVPANGLLFILCERTRRDVRFPTWESRS